MKFTYAHGMTKPFHVVAVKKGSDSFTVAHFDARGDADVDAEDRNNRSRKFGSLASYEVMPIADGKEAPKVKPST